MTYRVFATFTGSLLLLLGLSTAPAQAQEWGQEIQILTTAGYGDPLRTFVDSLSATLVRSPDTKVRRTPQDNRSTSFGDLRTELLADGVDLNSASHVFVRYRFEMDRGSRVIETIEDLYFIYRGNEARADLPLLHVSAQEPVVNELLRNGGVPSLVNMKSLTKFRDMLAFPFLYRQETALVEVGKQAVRDEATREQMILTHFLTEQMNAGGGAYVLSLPQPASVKVATLPSDNPVDPEGSSQ